VDDREGRRIDPSEDANEEMGTLSDNLPELLKQVETRLLRKQTLKKKGRALANTMEKG